MAKRCFLTTLSIFYLVEHGPSVLWKIEIMYDAIFPRAGLCRGVP